LSWRDKPLTILDIFSIKIRKISESIKNQGELRDYFNKLPGNNPKDDEKLNLYHMTSIENLESIMEKGLLSESELEKHTITPIHISNREIVQKRRVKTVDNNMTISDYACLYFQPRNAMLYEILHNDSIKRNILILHYSYPIQNGGYFTTENAVCADHFYTLDDISNQAKLNDCKNLIEKKSWYYDKIKKKEMMAEVLVHSMIKSENLSRVIYYNENLKSKLEELLLKYNKVELNNDKSWFFE